MTRGLKVFSHQHKALAATLALLFTGCAMEPVTTDRSGPLVPRYLESARAAGLVHTYTADTDFVVGGGAAAFDCDQDGDLDIALAGGLAPLSLFLNMSTAGSATRFEAEPTLGIMLGERSRRATGVHAIDIDNDAQVDLVVTRFGRNLVLRNRGGCRFDDVTKIWGLDGTGTWTTVFAASWIGNQRHPTLIFGNYVRRDRRLAKRGNCEPSVIMRPGVPASDGSPRYAVPRQIVPSYCPLSMRYIDWRNTGESDLWISNDRQYADPEGAEQLLSIGTTSMRQLTDADGWKTHKIWGMGLAAADVDGDGYLEVVATSMAENQFFALTDPGTGRPSFVNQAWRRGTASQRPYTGGDPRPSTSWHAEFADVNNDGRDDLLIVKGNVDRMETFAQFDPDSLLLGRGDGSFEEVGGDTGIALDRAGRGAAVFDADGDGCLDIVVVNRNQPVSFLRAVNCAALPGSVGLVLTQDGVNRFAIGARVIADSSGGHIDRQVSVGGGHAGNSLTPFRFGTGAAGRARVRVRWPDGVISASVPVKAGYLYRWDRASPSPTVVRTSQ